MQRFCQESTKLLLLWRKNRVLKVGGGEMGGLNSQVYSESNFIEKVNSVDALIALIFYNL